MLMRLHSLVVWTLFNAWISCHPASADDDPSWHKYVRAPPSRLVTPKAVLTDYTVGNVTDVDGLITGKSVAHLTRAPNATTDEVPTIVLDFGQDVVGLLRISFAGSESFARGYPGLRLIFSETKEFLTNQSDFTRSDNAQGVRFLHTPLIILQLVAVRSKPYEWLNQWGCEHDGQVCSDGLHGFRYVKILLDALPADAPHTVSYGHVAISSVSLEWSGYLGTPDTYTGWFECSDANLTQWWWNAAYTTEMCTDVFRANDTEPRRAGSESLFGKMVIHDGPKRDRDPYMGDLAVSALTSYLTHDIQEAARNVLEDLAQHQRSDGWIPPASINNYSLTLFDYPLWWVSCSWDYVFYTGNVSYIQAYYPTLLKVLDIYYPANTGKSNSLLVRPDGYGDYAFIGRPGSAAYYSALYVLALSRAAELASILDKPDDASRWNDRAAKVSKSFVDVLWDPTVKAFFDRNCTGSGCTAHAQDGNSLAILAGIVPLPSNASSVASDILDYLDKALHQRYGNTFYDAGGEGIDPAFSQRVYPFISYFEIAARFLASKTDSALNQMRRMYGWMASQDPGVTFWEGIGPGGKPYEDGFTSMAHGWSTGIVPLCMNYVLGVTPATPGFLTWDVKPVVGDLTWAKGQVPTARGGMQVSWSFDVDEDRIHVDVDAPAGTTGTVSVPSAGNDDRGGGRGMEVMLDGQLVYGAKSDVMARGVAHRDEKGLVRVQVQGGARQVLEFRKV
ncbi:glycoside hydrolase family 78 protein [Apiospora sp. TS-2023a]